MAGQRPGEPFRHEALIYAGEDEFLGGVLPFIHDGLEHDEPVLIALDAPKIRALRGQLGVDANAVAFADIRELGHNPARIIPRWREFVDARPAEPRGLRAIGEPIWPGRSDAALVECHRHESLLNLAFADADGFWLLCPYDAGGLAFEVLAESHQTHPIVSEGGVTRESLAFAGIEAAAAPFARPLPDPPRSAPGIDFTAGSLDALRRLVSDRAAAAGLDGERAARFVFAVNEIASNSVRHGGGHGRARVWEEQGALVCEVRDAGCIADPLADRQRPTPGQIGGYGLWLANETCDLVQVRSVEDGSVVRLHMASG